MLLTLGEAQAVKDTVGQELGDGVVLLEPHLEPLTVAEADTLLQPETELVCEAL